MQIEGMVIGNGYRLKDGNVGALTNVDEEYGYVIFEIDGRQAIHHIDEVIEAYNRDQISLF